MPCPCVIVTQFNTVITLTLTHFQFLKFGHINVNHILLSCQYCLVTLVSTQLVFKTSDISHKATLPSSVAENFAPPSDLCQIE